MAFVATKKDRKKIVRSIIQMIILILIFILLIRGLFVFRKYNPYDISDKSIVTGEDNGFIAISYIAVDREGNSSMISTNRLNEHLKALYENGFVTITQEDVLNYYRKNIPLPQKALYLMFEDGRRDTAIFAQKIMEKYNYIGTILNYAEKLTNKDSKFLKAKDLIELKESTFWELGSNGYRLSYINVFDRYNNFLGELTSLEYNKLRKYLERNYNQYLMDYIRDENNIPIETYNEMKNRIDKDYNLMKSIYTNKLDEMPKTYVLMHSNTGQFGNNDKVSSINESNIKNLFQMNFNREGYSVNNLDNNLFDLTRMQPQSYWYTNHLLMRIKDDLGQPINFSYGDIDKLKDWEIVSGAPEFGDSYIALTSTSQGRGLIRLLKSGSYDNMMVSCVLSGNKLGRQSIYLRADENLNQYLCVSIRNNQLYIEENGEILYQYDLDKFDGVSYQTIEENRQEALLYESQVIAESKSLVINQRNMDVITESGEESVLNNTVDTNLYIPSISIHEPAMRKLDIKLENNKLQVMIDGKTAANLLVSNLNKGYLYLESAWSEFGYSQRNIADDVYDGVFEDLLIKDLNDVNKVLYENRIKGFDKIINQTKEGWMKVINWFIKNL